jgi:hypothetical protein
MPRARKPVRILLLEVGVLSLLCVAPIQGQTQPPGPAVKGKGTPPPAAPNLVGVIVDLTKAETNNVGTVTVQPNAKNAKPVTFDVTEATRFEYFNQVNVWGTNFLAEHRGEKVAVFTVAGSKPLAAAKVQILLPKPKPRNPGPPPAQPLKPIWARGTVVDVTAGVITIKLPNYTPPPPVRGTVTDVGVNEDTDQGVITVQANGKLQTFVVDPTTEFQKLIGKTRKRISFLSIDQGETVEIFTRYGAPQAVTKVDVLVKGAGEAAIVYKDHFVKFVTKPGTKFDIDRAGKFTPVSLSTIVKGESVAILPDALRSHIAAEVRIMAPPIIHGIVESTSATAIIVKLKEKGQDVTKSVAINGATTYEVMTDKMPKPGGLADVKPGKDVDIWPGAVPPNVAEKVVIFHHVGKPLSLDGVVVTATANLLTVMTGGPQKSFPLNAATKFEALEGTKRRPAKATELKAGQKVHIVAAAEAPNAAQSVEIHIVAPKTSTKTPKETAPKPTNDAKKAKSP